MKKHNFCILTIAFLCIATICACGRKEKPDDISKEMYDSAVYAIKVVDLYLDGDATIGETREKLNDMEIPKAEIGGEYEGDFSVELGISSLKLDISAIEAGTRTISNLKEDRDELAEEINY